MVSPKYQRQGIGQAMIKDLTERARAQGCAWATADVLETNVASHTAFRRQGFEICGRATELELPTVMPEPRTAALSIAYRSLRKDDIPALQSIERQVWGATWVQAVGSDIRLLRRSLPQAFYNFLISNRTTGLVFERAGNIVGFAHANVTNRALKGRGFLCSVENAVEIQQAMLSQVGAWFASQGIAQMRVVLPNQIASAWIDGQRNNARSWLYLAKSLA
jgi:hypothetical protein